MATDMLQLDNLHAFYGKSHVLHGVDMTVGEGEIVSLLGRNGSGRSTTVQDDHGPGARRGLDHLPRTRRSSATRPSTSRIAASATCPRTATSSPSSRCDQNLLLGEKRGKRQTAALVASTTCTRMFPRLKERQHTEAGVLSGGEQQMLTLCRTLMGDPDLIMIDEPTEGLAPKIVELVAEYLKTLKTRGVSVLLVEQKLTIALEISERC